MSSLQSEKSLLLIGASRGLGYAMAAEYLKRGWRVVGTVRGERRTKLNDLAEASDGRIEIETVDITDTAQINGLRARLSGRTFDVLFVNAGVTNDPAETIAEVSTETFVRVMVTNALSPMRVVETLEDLVPSTGTIGVMSSGQGSVTKQYERACGRSIAAARAALNTFMRSFAARHAADPRSMVLMAPGWVRNRHGRRRCAADHRGQHSEPRPTPYSPCRGDQACNTSITSAARCPGDRAASSPQIVQVAGRVARPAG